MGDFSNNGSVGRYGKNPIWQFSELFPDKHRHSPRYGRSIRGNTMGDLSIMTVIARR